jgi:hypothetical protein
LIVMSSKAAWKGVVAGAVKTLGRTLAVIGCAGLIASASAQTAEAGPSQDLTGFAAHVRQVLFDPAPEMPETSASAYVLLGDIDGGDVLGRDSAGNLFTFKVASIEMIDAGPSLEALIQDAPGDLDLPSMNDTAIVVGVIRSAHGEVAIKGLVTREGSAGSEIVALRVIAPASIELEDPAAEAPRFPVTQPSSACEQAAWDAYHRAAAEAAARRHAAYAAAEAAHARAMTQATQTRDDAIAAAQLAYDTSERRCRLLLTAPFSGEYENCVRRAADVQSAANTAARNAFKMAGQRADQRKRGALQAANREFAAAMSAAGQALDAALADCANQPGAPGTPGVDLDEK